MAEAAQQLKMLQAVHESALDSHGSIWRKGVQAAESESSGCVQELQQLLLETAVAQHSWPQAVDLLKPLCLQGHQAAAPLAAVVVRNFGTTHAATSAMQTICAFAMAYCPGAQVCAGARCPELSQLNAADVCTSCMDC